MSEEDLVGSIASDLIHVAEEEHWNKLALTNMEIFIIPFKLFDLTWLTNLDLSRNRIHCIPPEICMLKQLQVFDISNNAIRELPSEFCKLRIT
jgi:CCR4-NOT transcription complex subunit 6